MTVPAFFRHSFVALALLLTLCVAQKAQAVATIVDLTALNNSRIFQPSAINNKGQILGNSGGHALLYSNGTMSDLGIKGGVITAMNNNGQFVGYVGFLPSYGFLFSNGIKTNLDDLLPSNSGWVLDSPTSINDKGQIVGEGTLNGERRAFLFTPEATPTPTPSPTATPSPTPIIVPTPTPRPTATPLTPRSIFVHPVDGSGLVNGEVKRPYLSTKPLLTAIISPKVEKTDRLFSTRRVGLWFDVTRIQVTDDGATCDPVPYSINGAQNALAVAHLIAPSTSPAYYASFPTINSKVSMEVRLSADAVVITLLDKALSEGLGKVGISLNADDMISIWSDVRHATAIQKALARFQPMPQGSVQWTRAVAATLKDIAFMDSIDQKIFVEAFKRRLKNKKGLPVPDKLGKEIIKSVAKNLSFAFKVWDYGQFIGDFVFVTVGTKGKPMVINFEASPLTERTPPAPPKRK